MSDMDELAKRLGNQQATQFTPVEVEGGDYRYKGLLVAIFSKRSGASRCVVEDEHGRLFIHRLEQIGFR